jgi:hypothetical protein
MTSTPVRRDIIKVVVTGEEAAAIKEKAGAARLSLSSYLRTLALGWTPKSTLDHQAVLALAKTNADLGRLGGLLKLWLSDMPNLGTSTVDVRRVLHEIEGQQAILREITARLSRRP